MKYSKVLTIAISALFCLTVAGAIFTSDDSSAAEKTAHNIYIEVVSNPEGALDSSFWMLVECENTNDAFIAQANKVAQALGFDLTFAMSGDYLSVTYGGGGSSACWYEKDGVWAAMDKTDEQYANSSVIGLALKTGWINSTQYDALTDAQKAKWQADSMMPGYYMKKVDAKVTDVPETKTYHVLGKVIKDDLSIETSKWIEFENYKTPEGFVIGANFAFADAGMDKVKFTIGGDYIGSQYGDSYNNCSYYAKDGKWVAVDDTKAQYVSGDSVAFGFVNGYINGEKYNSLSDDAKKDWKDSGYPDSYIYVFSDAIDGYKPSSNNNLVLYIAIGVVAVIAVAAIAFFVFKKK